LESWEIPRLFAPARSATLTRFARVVTG
jgi:hypothetical protein